MSARLKDRSVLLGVIEKVLEERVDHLARAQREEAFRAADREAHGAPPELVAVARTFAEERGQAANAAQDLLEEFRLFWRDLVS